MERRFALAGIRRVAHALLSSRRLLSKGAAITNVDEKKVTESRKRKGYYRWMRLGPLKPRSKADKDITDGKLFPESG